MKAIVAEIDKKQMLVITEKGDFIKVKRRLSVGIGDEIEVQPQKIYVTYKRLASLAACFMACILLSTGVYAYYTPYSYVSVDINPSLTLSLNRFEKVISVNPLNEDAEALVKDIKGLKNKEIDNALSELIKGASLKGYIDENAENQVMVVVSANNPSQEKELADIVSKAAAVELAKVNDNYEVMVEKTSIDDYKAALSNKMSPGKEILADKLREVNPEIKDEEVKEMSVREVVKLIKEGKKEEKSAEKDSKEKDKEENKDKNKTEQAVKDKDNSKQNGKDAIKASAEAKDKKKDKDSKAKTEASTSKKKDDAKDKDAKVKAVEEDNGDKDAASDEDSENGEQEKDKKDKTKDQDNKKDSSGSDGQSDVDKSGNGDKDKEKK